MSKIVARISHESYPIIVGPHAIDELTAFLQGTNYSNCVIIVDKKLKAIKAKVISKIKSLYPQPVVIELPSTEETKSFKKIYPLYSKLLDKKIDRKALLIAVGGGVIGDAAGFLASTYLRGIDWVVVPTTLLSQVDSSVGGKTAVNHETGKNLIGTFYQPKAVFSDVTFLKTLSKRDLVSGLGETLKYSFILDRYFFYEFVEKKDDALKGNAEVLTDFVSKGIRWKTGIVSRDERDVGGLRELLNFGHTFGHAIESYFNYKLFNHGEAVILGMKFAIIVSYLKGYLPQHEFSKAIEGLNALKIPKLPAKMNASKIWQIMQSDKKNVLNTVSMVLIKSIGRASSKNPIDEKEFLEAFRIIREGL